MRADPPSTPEAELPPLKEDINVLKVLSPVKGSPRR